MPKTHSISENAFAKSNAIPGILPEEMSLLLQKLKADFSDGNMNTGIARKLYESMIDYEIISSYKFPTHKSSDGYYHIQVKDPSRPKGRRQIKASTLEKLIAAVLKHEHGTNGRTRKTFRDIYVIAQEEQLRYVKDSGKRLSVMNSVARHFQTYDRFFAGTEFETKYIDEITEKDILKVCLMNLERYDLRKRAFDSMKAVITTTFRLAYSERWTEENVCLRVDFSDPRIENMILPEVSIDERSHTEEELNALFRECKRKLNSRPSLFTARALSFQILTGLRRGEVCPLKWSDIKVTKSGISYIEISREMIEVKKSRVNDKSFCDIVSHTKTGKNRRIPIWDELQALLDELKEAHDRYFPESEFLFPANSPIGCLNLHTVYNFYYRCCQGLGISLCRDVIKGTHSFRRNFAERVDDSEIACKLLGNDKRVLKKNYYDGLNLERARNALAESPFSAVGQ